MRGTVKFFSQERGYGFIVPDEGGVDCFVHISDFNKSNLGKLTEADMVEYDIAAAKDGRPKAINLRVVV